jgi:YidC/Oxa1 family membrane protein insertase
MDKNTFTGVFLIMLIFAGFVWFTRPSAAELKKEKETQQKLHTQDSLKKLGIKTAPAAANATAAAVPQAKPVDTAALKAPFGSTLQGEEKFITLENDSVKIKLSTKGGRVYSAELKDYKTFDKKPLILFDGSDNSFGYTFNAGNTVVRTAERFFTPNGGNVKVSGKDSATVTMRLSYSPTQYVDYIYTLHGDGYKLGFTIKPVGMDNMVANANAISLDWNTAVRKQEASMLMERQYSTVWYNKLDDGVDYLSEAKDDAKDISDKKVQWVSFKAHFFSSVLISNKGFSKANVAVSVDTADHEHIKEMKATLVLAREADGSFPMTYYFGPNRFSTLKAQGYDLEKQINMGWGPLKYINRWAVLPVFNVLTKFNWNYGLIILALTVILKLVLSPLTYKSYLSMAKMRVLKPEMDEIKGKVGEDNPTLLQQEYLKLYKKAGVNPLGGCLPLVLQMPIVIAFFRFFPGLFELRGQSFLWMHDLSTYDSVINFGFTIPFIGDHLSAMCLLMTISTLIYTYFNNQISGVSGQMKYVGYITPVIFLGALNSYPAGLNYYYFLANMFTFLQQYIIRLMVDDKKIHAQIQENKKKPEDTKKKKTGFAARMEEAMRHQQQLQQAQGKKK